MFSEMIIAKWIKTICGHHGIYRFENCIPISLKGASLQCALFLGGFEAAMRLVMAPINVIMSPSDAREFTVQFLVSRMNVMAFLSDRRFIGNARAK